MCLAEVVRTTVFRWTVGIALVLLFQSTIICGLIYLSTMQSATEVVDKALASDCAYLASLSRNELVDEIHEKVAMDVRGSGAVGLFDGKGQSLAGDLAEVPLQLRGLAGPVAAAIRKEGAETSHHENRAIRCKTTSGDDIVVARDTQEIDRLRSVVEKALIVVTLPSIIVAVLLGSLVAIQGQRRFITVNEAVDAVMAGDLARRLPMRGPRDSFDRLSQAVNRMLDRLQASIEGIRALGDDIAHAMRTPLTRARARLERGTQNITDISGAFAAGRDAIADIDHALTIVAALLRIRAIEQKARGAAFSRSDLGIVLADATDLYRPVAEERDIELTLRADGPAFAIIDRDLMMEAVCNLLDNAIKFTPRGGTVCCALLAQAGEAEAVRISDNGAGIPSVDREAVLRRFHRGAVHHSVEGTGIGLSLVTAIVRLHGFTLSIGDARPGCEISIICGNHR